MAWNDGRWWRRAIRVALATAMFGAGVGSWAQEAAVAQGAVSWKTGDLPALQFEVKTAVGLYAKLGDSVQLMVYGSVLPPDVLAYAVRRQAAVLNGTASRFKFDPALNEKLRAASEQSASLWTRLSDVLVAPGAARGTTLAAKDLTGIGVCIAMNCRLYSGGVYGEDYTRQVTQLQFPVVMPQSAQPMLAQVSLDIRKSAAGEPPKQLRLKGSIPFHLIEE